MSTAGRSSQPSRQSRRRGGRSRAASTRVWPWRCSCCACPPWGMTSKRQPPLRRRCLPAANIGLMNDELKRLAAEAIDSHRDELVALSSPIHATPELAFEEFRAVDTLPAASDGPVVALLCEYDALPEIGHACGHNLMAMAPIAAAVGLQAVLDRLRGRVAIVGTPAEEGGGGKVIMLQRGGLAGVEATLLVHPSSHSVVKTEALACEHYDVEFHGKAAHAAGSPEKGVNALNAMILSFNHIDALRQHILPSARIHGIIRHGGDAPNIVPEYSQGSFMIRAASNSYLDELMDKVRRCFEAAALAT